MADKKNPKEKDEEEEKKAGEEGDEEGKEEGAEGGDEAAAKRKKKRKLIIIGAAAAVVLIAAGGGGYYYKTKIAAPVKAEASLKKGKKKKGEEAERTTGSSVKALKQNPNEWVPGIVPGHEGEDVVYYNLPEFLVNLDTGSKQTSFIKMKVTLECPSEGDSADAIESSMPRIIDKFNTYLRLLRTSDISGSAGLYRLREELLLQVNKEIYPSKVNDVLFQEIIVQ